MIRTAFTLIELLVVIAIIAILMSLLAPALSLLRSRAQAAETVIRLENVHQAFARLGQDEGGTAHVLQRAAAFGGVYTFAHQTTTQFDAAGGTTTVRAGTAAPREGSWLTYGETWQFRFPWGKASGVARTGTAGTPNEVWIYDQAPLTRRLDQLSERFTVALLAAAALLPGDDPVTPGDESAAAYTGDRDRRATWNDRWGHPLVIAAGLYQPGSSAQLRDDKAQYQYNRAVYLAAGAAGPELDVPLGADWVANRANLWTQVRTVCQAAEWTETGFDRAPWTGVRRMKSQRRICFLSAPQELR